MTAVIATDAKCCSDGPKTAESERGVHIGGGSGGDGSGGGGGSGGDGSGDGDSDGDVVFSFLSIRPVLTPLVVARRERRRWSERRRFPEDGTRIES